MSLVRSFLVLAWLFAALAPLSPALAGAPYLCLLDADGNLSYWEDEEEVFVDSGVREARLAGPATLAYIDREGDLQSWQPQRRGLLAREPRRVRTGVGFAGFVESDGSLSCWSPRGIDYLSSGPIHGLFPGLDYFAFQARDDEFRLWRQGEEYRLSLEAPLEVFTQGPTLAWISRDPGLWVFHENLRERLTDSFPRQVALERDLLAYVEEDGTLRVWTPDGIDYLSPFPPEILTLGPQTVAFRRSGGELSAWISHQVESLDHLRPQEVHAGRSLVAWKSQDDQVKVFVSGLTHWLGQSGSLPLQVQDQFVVFSRPDGTSVLWKQGTALADFEQPVKLRAAGPDYALLEEGYQGLRLWTPTGLETLTDHPPEAFHGNPSGFLYLVPEGDLFLRQGRRNLRLRPRPWESISVGDELGVHTLIDRGNRRRSRRFPDPAS